MGRPFKFLSGTFGLLTVIKFSYQNERRKSYYLCSCVCGNIVFVRSDSLVSKTQQSCVCLRDTTKGNYQTKAHSVWQSIVQRCYNSNNESYHRYGGRGILMSERWRDFNNFLADMGQPPDKHEIHRKDNDLGYSKDNCIWVERIKHRHLHRP